MFSFFKCDALVSFSNLGEAFTVSLTAHSQVHANFGAFAGKIHSQTLNDFRINVFGNTNAMLVGPLQGSAGILLDELGCWCATLWAGFRGAVAFMDITADSTDKLFHVYTPLELNNIDY